MPELQLNNSLTLDVVHRVERMLPAFDTRRQVDFARVDADLRCYFATYGFHALATPSHYSLGFLNLPDYRVATHYWHRRASAATVFIAHGLFDHVGLYLDLVDALLAADFSVVAVDFPGHGLSEGEPAVIRDFAEYALVIGETLDALRGKIPRPLFAVGQSTGSAALLNYVLAAGGRQFSKLVLLAPLIEPRSWEFINVTHLALSRFIRFVKRKFATNSHRPEFNQFILAHDPLQARHVSVEWVGAMKKWINTFDSYAQSDIATLIIQGDADSTVAWEKNVPRIQAKFASCRVEMVAGAMHHLVKEGDPWRDATFAKAVQFLQPLK